MLLEQYSLTTSHSLTFEANLKLETQNIQYYCLIVMLYQEQNGCDPGTCSTRINQVMQDKYLFYVFTHHFQLAG